MANPLEKAFQRHSRAQQASVSLPEAQAPKQRLSRIQSTPSWVPPVPTVPHRDLGKLGRQDKVPAKQSEWLDFLRLGNLVQGESEALICYERDRKSTMFMFKLVEKRNSAGTEDAKFKQTLKLRHTNIVAARHVIESAVGTHVGFDYFRFTLEEVLGVHMLLEEAHLHTIATAVRYGYYSVWSRLI